MLRFLVCLLFISGLTSSLRGEHAKPIADTFTQSSLKDRKASRGEWRIADGVAMCSHDDELYKKFKDHGPILTYESNYRDGVVETVFKGSDAKETQRIVFTMDGEKGHVVRVIMRPGNPSRLLVWNDEEKKPTVLATDLPALSEDQWTPLRVETKGINVDLRIGEENFSFEHPGIARQKTNAKISFAFGNFAAKEFHLIPKN